MKYPSFLIILLIFSLSYCKQYCQRDEPCWPTDGDVLNLYNKLDPGIPRILDWHQNQPRISAVPYQSPGDQPLYGLGVPGLSPLYISTPQDRGEVCFKNSFAPEFCLASVRNVPYELWTPSFVIWPLTALHVQEAVKFATKHNICVMIAGTGHDFLNRHSCNDGIFIRTALLKDIEWDLEDKKGFGNPDGSVRFGAGIVFSEAQYSAAKTNRVIASGWAITVGVIGWSIGGGHGPFGPQFGLGVDNILEIELATADGNLIKANSKQNADLYWALRGGGGSVWGAITSITVKAHKIPEGGFTFAQIAWAGGECKKGKKQRNDLIDKILLWMQTLDSKWGGLVFITPKKTQDTSLIDCGAQWTIFAQYVYQGSKSNTDFIEKVQQITSYGIPIYKKLDSYDNWYQKLQDYQLEPIFPYQNLFQASDVYVGGVPSVIVNRQQVQNGELASTLRQLLDVCQTDSRCNRQELYQDITGNIGSPQDEFVSISSGFRTGMLHYVAGGINQSELNKLYTLGENSYFSESAYTGTDAWRNRYWGDNYAELKSIKKKYDPQGVFWCRHCVTNDDDDDQQLSELNSLNQSD